MRERDEIDKSGLVSVLMVAVWAKYFAFARLSLWLFFSSLSPSSVGQWGCFSGSAFSLQATTFLFRGSGDFFSAGKCNWQERQLKLFVVLQRVSC